MSVVPLRRHDPRQAHPERSPLHPNIGDVELGDRGGIVQRTDEVQRIAHHHGRHGSRKPGCTKESHEPPCDLPTHSFPVAGEEPNHPGDEERGACGHWQIPHNGVALEHLDLEELPYDVVGEAFGGVLAEIRTDPVILVPFQHFGGLHAETWSWLADG